MKRFVLVVLLAAVRLRAATFLVPADRELVLAGKAVVVARAGASHAQRAEGGWIETVTTMSVEESIRGPLAAGQSFDITELGGFLGESGYVVAGAPRYTANERYLLILDRTDRGSWTAKNMALGKFAFTSGPSGEQLLVRDAESSCGWDYDGAPHREPRRLAGRFLDYVRGVVRGEERAVDYIAPDAPHVRTDAAEPDAVPSINSYLLQIDGGSGSKGMRWNAFPAAVTFLSHGTQPGALAGGLTAAQRGLAAWTADGGSNVVYVYGGVTTTSNGLSSGGADNINSIQFNDPAGEIPGAFTGKGGDTLAVGGAWVNGTVHNFGGEQFYTITEADLVVQDGISGAGLTGNGLDHVLTHELGHTLGLRHSDQPPAGGTSTSNAIMNSSVDFNNDPYGSSLQGWDREAIDAVYGSGVAQCTPPQITAQPVSVALQGSSVVLSVAATGTAPLQYQWYIGASGSTAQIAPGGTAAQLVVSPATTTSYWVRVSNGCAPSADSAAAVVTVNGCPAVFISSYTTSDSIIQGHSAALSVSANGGSSPLTYQWYLGSASDTAHPIDGATAATYAPAPAATAAYWVRARNACGAFEDSGTITVTVTPCDAPRVVVPPAGGQFVPGDVITLSAAILGTPPLQLQWMQNGSAIPNGGAATVSVGPLFGAATFAVRVQNDCGDVTTAAVSYTPTQSCIAPSIVAQPADVAVAAGSAVTLSVTASGTSLVYRWYQGQRLDFTRPVGGSSPALYVASVSGAASYWVRISNGCGSVDSRVVTVVPGSARRRAAGR